MPVPGISASTSWDAILARTTRVLREKFQRDPYTINDARQKLETFCIRATPMQAIVLSLRLSRSASGGHFLRKPGAGTA
jgi:hypothetical protein